MRPQLDHHVSARDIGGRTQDNSQHDLTGIQVLYPCISQHHDDDE